MLLNIGVNRLIMVGLLFCRMTRQAVERFTPFMVISIPRSVKDFRLDNGCKPVRLFAVWVISHKMEAGLRTCISNWR